MSNLGAGSGEREARSGEKREAKAGSEKRGARSRNHRSCSLAHPGCFPPPPLAPPASVTLPSPCFVLLAPRSKARIIVLASWRIQDASRSRRLLPAASVTPPAPCFVLPAPCFVLRFVLPASRLKARISVPAACGYRMPVGQPWPPVNPSNCLFLRIPGLGPGCNSNGTPPGIPRLC